MSTKNFKRGYMYVSELRKLIKGMKPKDTIRIEIAEVDKEGTLIHRISRPVNCVRKSWFEP
jgi:hypothetical protein